jgi:hypothetical protein
VNTNHSVELIIQPFPDQSFIVYWTTWKEVSAGLYEPVEERTAAANLGVLKTILDRFVTNPGLLSNVPGPHVMWRCTKIPAQETNN